MNTHSIIFIVLLVYSLVYGTDKWWPMKCNTYDTLNTVDKNIVVRYKCSKTRYTRAHITEGKFNGLYQSWDKQGNLRVFEEYCMDKKCGKVKVFDSLGNVLTSKYYSKIFKPIGLHKMYYSANLPKRFITYNDSGQKHGWEVFWYENGNVKDSIRFQNDSTFQRKSFYFNGKVASTEKDIYGQSGYDATSFDPKGRKTGQIVNGTGTILVCDSLGNDCKKLVFKDGKRVLR